MTRRIGSLFSGIGGLELGLERAGVGRTVWQVEKDPYCRRVLARHWPDAVRYEDVCTVDWSTVEPVEVLCGGFPCPPFSSSGKRLGMLDPRWLWPAFAAAIRALRPRYVVVENVADLLRSPAFGVILSDLHSLGFDAEWSTVSACSVGAPHRRRRVFVVAHSNGGGRSKLGVTNGRQVEAKPEDGHHAHRCRAARDRTWNQGRPGSLGMADGLPGWVQRRRALGNAVVPQVAEVVGRRLLELANA